MALARYSILSLYAILLAGCAATLNVSSHLDPTADFSSYRTYQWGPADPLPAGDPRLDRNGIFIDGFQGAVEKQMRARGIQMVDRGDVDLLIHVHAVVQDRIDINTIDRARGYVAIDDWRPLTRTYEAGTIVLDVIDARRNTLIWRGWVQTRLDDVLGNRTRMSQVIEQGVMRMFERYPRGLGNPESTPRREDARR
jgi:hypothetical protein